jgi:hypothetical protein
MTFTSKSGGGGGGGGGGVHFQILKFDLVCFDLVCFDCAFSKLQCCEEFTKRLWVDDRSVVWGVQVPYRGIKRHMTRSIEAACSNTIRFQYPHIQESFDTNLSYFEWRMAHCLLML